MYTYSILLFNNIAVTPGGHFESTTLIKNNSTLKRKTIILFLLLLLVTKFTKSQLKSENITTYSLCLSVKGYKYLDMIFLS